MHTNERKGLKIESLAYGGSGLGRLPDGKVVFVQDAVPGDLVCVRMLNERDRFSRAVIERVIEPSPARVEPPCPYHARCGGCGLQQVSYPEQLRWKRRFVIDALERIGRLDGAEALVADTVASPATEGYRNKVELVVCREGKKLLLGFHARSGPEVVPVQRCLLLPASHATLPARLAGALGYAFAEADPSLQRVGVRISQKVKDVEVALWTAPGPCNRGFVTKVLGSALKTTSLVRVLVAGALAKRDVRKVEVLGGRGHWREDLGGFRHQISAPSFFQVNTPAAELLLARVLEELAPDGRRVADLYSGAGTFTLPLARRAQEVIAIETVESSVRDLRRGLTRNGLEAQILRGDVGELLSGLKTVDCAVVDPPRGGLHADALRAIADNAPRTLVYVSCDPATLARDIRGFLSAGYQLRGVTPIDLFPQTWHIEAVAKLEKSPEVSVQTPYPLRSSLREAKRRSNP
jgi:23S rRNA (uracil1939-C5)-methyltransferase